MIEVDHGYSILFPASALSIKLDLVHLIKHLGGLRQYNVLKNAFTENNTSESFSSAMLNYRGKLTRKVIDAMWVARQNKFFIGLVVLH